MYTDMTGQQTKDWEMFHNNGPQSQLNSIILSAGVAHLQPYFEHDAN